MVHPCLLSNRYFSAVRPKALGGSGFSPGATCNIFVKWLGPSNCNSLWPVFRVDKICSIILVVHLLSVFNTSARSISTPMKFKVSDSDLWRALEVLCLVFSRYHMLLQQYKLQYSTVQQLKSAWHQLWQISNKDRNNACHVLFYNSGFLFLTTDTAQS